MSEHRIDEERIFLVARELKDSDFRDEYLAQICDGNQALLERVKQLLRVHDDEQTFLKSKSLSDSTEVHTGETEKIGEQVGHYKLLQKIGEGGFGVVYMAEQSRPVRRKVALKVIKPGMDTAAVVARFEAERQALALMNHPSIAQVFDGGTTDSGRPYFVMELVKGVPITDFCDENKLPVSDRLQIFSIVCQAIQHAHQKGVIHRDIKPSNVLITLHDGQPVPKVIDFGISKAISQQLTEKTLFTAHGQMVGTPRYMSPEQAEMSGLDVDTRSDVYSLGVLLYELLTGFTPLDLERIRSTAYAELQRLICEEEPIHPSRRCTSHGERSANFAANRRTDTRKLRRLLQGELDWIALKSLEKDRNRRYTSPQALAEDVQRYLGNETVTACPPSLHYRTRKFIRRHKGLTMIGVTLLVLAIVAASGWAIAIDKYHEEREQRIQRTIELAFSAAAIGQTNKALDLIEEEQLGEQETSVLSQMLAAEIHSNEGNPTEAVEILERLDAAEGDVIQQGMLANAYFDAGDYWSYFRLPVTHGNLIPETGYENLFVGKAVYWLDYSKSISLLDKAAATTPSPLCFTYRARSYALRAATLRHVDRATCLDLIDQAVKDADTAVRLFQARSATKNAEMNGSSVNYVHLLVMLHAYDIYKQPDTGQDVATQQDLDQKADGIILKAKQLSDALFSKDGSRRQLTRIWRAFFLQRYATQLYEDGHFDEALARGNESDEMLESTSYGDWIRAAKLLKSDWEDREAFERYRNEALDLALKKDDSESQPLVIALLYLMNKDTNAGLRDVNRLISKLKQNDPTLGEKVLIAWIYNLTGQFEERRKYSEEVLAGSPEIRSLKTAELIFKFYSSEGSKKENETFLKAGQDSGVMTSRLLLVGIQELAKGKRDEALKFFTRAEREGLFHAWEHALAAAFAERLRKQKRTENEDAAPWPSWLQAHAPNDHDAPL